MLPDTLIMKKIIVLIGQETEKTELFFQNKIPSLDDPNQEEFFFFKKHANYLDLYVFFAYTFQDTKYSKSTFKEIEEELKNKGQIIQYLLYASKPYDFKKNYDFYDMTKGKLSIIYESKNSKLVQNYKTAYYPKYTIEEDNFYELIQNISQSSIKFAQQSNSQIALLIGKPGVGKTSLYNKITNQIIYDKNTFNQFIFCDDNYQLWDSPSFDLDNDVQLRETILQSYQNFFRKHQSFVSTLLLLIKFDRYDLMKQSFYSIFKYFKQFVSHIVVIVTYWQPETNDSDQLKQQLRELIQRTKIKDILFFQKDADCQSMKFQIKQALTCNKGINVSNSIFTTEITSEQKIFQKNFEENMKQIEVENHKIHQKKIYEQDLQDKINVLTQENLIFERKILKNEELIKNYQNELSLIQQSKSIQYSKEAEVKQLHDKNPTNQDKCFQGNGPSSNISGAKSNSQQIPIQLKSEQPIMDSRQNSVTYSPNGPLGSCKFDYIQSIIPEKNQDFESNNQRVTSISQNTTHQSDRNYQQVNQELNGLQNKLQSNGSQNSSQTDFDSVSKQNEQIKNFDPLEISSHLSKEKKTDQKNISQPQIDSQSLTINKKDCHLIIQQPDEKTSQMVWSQTSKQYPNDSKIDSSPNTKFQKQQVTTEFNSNGASLLPSSNQSKVELQSSNDPPKQQPYHQQQQKLDNDNNNQKGSQIPKSRFN